MLLEIPPELFPLIITSLSGKDVSLCSKLCYHLAAPTLWENVRITWDRLLASTSTPSHIAFVRNLRIDYNVCFGIRRSKGTEQELKKKLMALLMELSSPTTGMTALKNLNVSGCNLSDAELKHIGNLTGLTELDISGNKNISDAGLGYLCHLKGLKNLNISHNWRISNVGLEHLRHLTGLKNLNVSLCNIYNKWTRTYRASNISGV